MRTINITKKLARGALAAMLALSPLVSSAGGITAYALGDATHTGMTHLQVTPDSGNNRIQAIVNTEGQFNAWAGSDVGASTEWKRSDMSWSNRSWNHSDSILKNGAIPAIEDVPGVSTGSVVDIANQGTDFKTKLGKGEGDGWNGSEAIALVMSFPGWGAGDRVPDVTTAKKSQGKRNDSELFKPIDATAAANAATAVNTKLIGSLNSALESLSQNIRDERGRPVSMSREGIINATWILASGKLPKPGSTISYNTKTGTFSNVEKDFVDAKVIVDPEAKEGRMDDAGATAIQVHAPAIKVGSGDAGDTTKYTYGVVKGYHSGVYSTGETYASDVYLITWYDVAMSMSAQLSNDSIVEESSASTTVVGDQVENLTYKLVSGLLGLLNIKSVDKLVFEDGGNLLKSNVWTILMAIQVPFIIASFLILSLVIIDAYRKINMSYLSTGEQKSILSSVGRVSNALIAIAFTPIATILMIYLDQAIIDFAVALNAMFNGFNFGKAGWIAVAGGGIQTFMLNALGIQAIMALFYVFIDIKYNYRYLARAVSFGLYFCISPVIFALDSLKGSGKLFEYGPTATGLWKNLTGTILMRSIDAIAIVFSFNLTKLLLGGGFLLKGMAFMAGQAISDSIMGLVGVQSGSIKGIESAAQNTVKDVGKKAGALWATTAGFVHSKGRAAVASGRNKDQMELENKLMSGSKKNIGAIKMGSEDASKEQLNPSSVPSTGDGNGTKKPSNTNPKLQAQAKGTPAGGQPTQGSGFVAAVGEPQQVDAMAQVVSAGGGEEQGDFGQEQGGTPITQVATGANTTPVADNGLGQKVATQSAGSSSAGQEQVDQNGEPQQNGGGLWASIKQGASNQGITGDKNTVGRGMLDSGVALDPTKYKMGENGRFVPIDKATKRQDRLRDVGRYLGGALNPFGSETFAPNKTLGQRVLSGTGQLARGAATQAFIVSSLSTPFAVDDWVAGAMVANQMERINTGGNARSGGVMSTLSRTFAGRVAGMKESAFEIDEYAPGATADNRVGAMGGKSLIDSVGSKRSPEAMGYTHSHDIGQNHRGETVMRTRTEFSSDTATSKVDQAALQAMSNLSETGFGQDKTQDGYTHMSLNDVISGIDSNASGTANTDAVQLAQYMHENGYDSVTYNGEGHIAFDKTLKHAGTVDVSDAQMGTNDYYVKTQLETKGAIVDHQSQSVQVMAGEGQVSTFRDSDRAVRREMGGNYSGAVKQAINDGNGAEAARLLREQVQMTDTPSAYAQKYQGQTVQAHTKAAEKAAKGGGGPKEPSTPHPAQPGPSKPAPAQPAPAQPAQPKVQPGPSKPAPAQPTQSKAQQLTDSRKQQQARRYTSSGGSGGKGPAPKNRPRTAPQTKGGMPGDNLSRSNFGRR